MVERDYKEYGNWLYFYGLLEESTVKIEEAKSMLYKEAEETLQKIGVNIEDQHVEWIINQAYHDGKGFVMKDYPLAQPCVTIAWKVKVKNNG